MVTKITACLQILILSVLLIPLRADTTKSPSKNDLLGLILLELLNEGLESNSDLTLNPRIGEAAGYVLFFRTSVRDSFIALIDRSGANDASADSAAGGGRASIESRVISFCEIKMGGGRSETVTIVNQGTGGLEITRFG